MAFRLIGCFLVVFILGCQNNKKTEVLTLANYMQQMQMEYAAMGNAIKQNKFEGVAFHANNLLEVSNSIAQNHNNNAKLLMPFNTQSAIYIDPIIAALKKEVDANNSIKIKNQYQLLTNNCKSCHTSNKVAPAFIPIEF